MKEHFSTNMAMFLKLHFESSSLLYVQGDSDVISRPAGFRRHLVGKTLRNVFHCHVAEIRFAGKLVIMLTFRKSTDQMLFK